MQTSLKDHNMEKQFYCKEWNNVGYICSEGQCPACAKVESNFPLNESKEEKIKRLIQQKIDGLYVKFWNPETPFSEASEIDKAIGTLQELLKEIETL